MTAQTRAVNKARFEQGDKPQGSDYADLIDSGIILVETSGQVMSGPLTVTELIATTVSAATGNFTTVSAASMTGDTMTLTGTVSASAANFGTLVVGGEAIVPSSQRAAIEIYIEVTAVVTCSSTSLFTAIQVSASTGTFTPIDFSGASTQMRVTYTGATEKDFQAAAYISSKLNSGSNDLIEYVLLRNGTALNRTKIKRFATNATDFGSIATGCVVQMSATDTLSIGIRNETDVVNVDVGNAILVVSEV